MTLEPYSKCYEAEPTKCRVRVLVIAEHLQRYGDEQRCLFATPRGNAILATPPPRGRHSVWQPKEVYEFLVNHNRLSYGTTIPRGHATMAQGHGRYLNERKPLGICATRYSALRQLRITRSSYGNSHSDATIKA